AGAGWLASRLQQDLAEGAPEVSLLVESLVRERDAAAQERLVQAAALSGEAVERLKAEARRGRLAPALFARVVDARIVLLFEGTMHDGRVPGFFDGQFAELHALDATAYERMLAIALDARVNLVMRSLAIMAVHEARRPDLREELAPLLMDPTREIMLQEPDRRMSVLTDTEARDFAAARLSQYVRFSLAKAGVPGPIDEKIARLAREAAKYLALADAARRQADAAGALLQDDWLGYLERAADYCFEVGYHHQQLDRFAEAERHYRLIIEMEEPVRAKRWAHYNLACIRALTGRGGDAIEQLRLAVDAGFKDVSWARRDGDLASVRDDPRFREVLDALESGTDEDGEDAAAGRSYGR
ncbi:MAG: hypothetical protein HY812_12305, partial [Planctomycetes bacterium]|nr:hypothetical protein [Planctomycetota bacterium]